MGWKLKLRDELIARIQPTGLTVYLVYDSNAGSPTGKIGSTKKRDWQDQLIAALTGAGINVVKANWDLDTYNDRGVLITFFANKIMVSDRVKNMLKLASAIRWIILVNDTVIETPEDFIEVADKDITDTDGAVRVRVFKREKVYV